MSKYQNMTVDFPRRIGKLLSEFEPSARVLGREVTLLLAFAGPGIILPLERLRPVHPAQETDKLGRLMDLKKALEAVPFAGSALWPANGPGSWQYGGPLETLQGPPKNWPEIHKPSPLGPQKRCWDILVHIRNALSHGNVYTRGQFSIEALVFLSWNSQQDQRYMYIKVSVDDFRQFFRNWLAVLEPISLPSFIVMEESAA